MRFGLLLLLELVLTLCAIVYYWRDEAYSRASVSIGGAVLAHLQRRELEEKHRNLEERR